MNHIPPSKLIRLTTEIVGAYVSRHSVSPGGLPGLMSQVHEALATAREPKRTEPPAPPTRLMPVRKTITPDHLISLEDGRRYKSLRRHLRERGITPAEYRAKWGLPADYPMVAPNYSKKRSELARSIGFGRRPGKRTPGLIAPATGQGTSDLE